MALMEVSTTPQSHMVSIMKSSGASDSYFSGTIYRDVILCMQIKPILEYECKLPNYP